MLKYMAEEFTHKLEKKFGNGWKYKARRLGRKEKDERNLQTGKFLQVNPLIQAVKEIDTLINLKEMQYAFKVIKLLYLA